MKSRKTGMGVIASVIASMMGGKEPKTWAPKWQGVMRKSVALTDHRGACNRVYKHTEKQANARRRRAIVNQRKKKYGEYRY